jgi:hypothetical protein
LNARDRDRGTDGGAVTAVIRKVPSGTAIGSGTVLHSGSINLKGTADTLQTLALSSNPDDLVLAVGDSLALDVTGVLTSATGVATCGLCPLAEPDREMRHGAQPGGPASGPPPVASNAGALATRRWSSVRTIRAATADAK